MENTKNEWIYASYIRERRERGFSKDPGLFDYDHLTIHGLRVKKKNHLVS